MIESRAEDALSRCLARLRPFQVVDGHVHFDSIDLAKPMLADQQLNGAGQFAIQVIGRVHTAPGSFKQAEAIWFKHLLPQRVFVFGGLDFSGMIDQGLPAPLVPFERQLAQLISCGFDGLKMLSGKPNVRQRIGQPLDAAVFTPLLALLEDTGFPVLWHVSDPAEFWNADAVPLWAKKHRWWYDSSHPARQQIEQEISHVLARHPRLNLVLPHFFFLSGDLAAADRFLQEHPKIFLDLAPGIEMYHHFTAQPEAARRFFTRHAKRIIFGTDIGMMGHGTGPLRGVMVRAFLETDAVFAVPDDPAMTPDDRPALRGLALDDAVLRDIYSGNFHRWLGRQMPLPWVEPQMKQMLGELIERDRRLPAPATAAARIEPLIRGV